MSKKLLLFLFACLLALPATAQTVFINEIHYDNTGGDTGEFVEIAGPAGTDLTGWSVVLYNGSGGASYATINLSGTIDNEGSSGFGALSFAQAGIQNGDPDGLALVDAGNNVIQFLSYEGSFTATNGIANGMMSVDIGVDEQPAPAAGNSVQLTGAGTTYSDFAWAGPGAESPGSINAMQVFTGGAVDAPIVDADIFINEIDYRGSDPNDTFLELVVGPNDEDLSDYFVVLYRADGTVALAPDNITPIILPVSAFTAGVTVDDFDFYVFFGSVDVALNLFSNPGDALAICKDDLGDDGIPESLVSNGEDNPTIQFLSQAGTTMAVEGCASGATSIDLGVTQAPGAPDGTSVGLGGTSITPDAGGEFADFTPRNYSTSNPASSTPGEPNLYQVLETDDTVVCPGPFQFSDFSSVDDEFVEVETVPGIFLDGLYLVNYDGRSGAILNSYAYTNAIDTDSGGSYSMGDAGANPSQVVPGFTLVNTRSGLAVVTREPAPSQNITTFEYPEEICAIQVYQSTGNVLFSFGTPGALNKQSVTDLDWSKVLFTDALPETYQLSANYPNPFNPSTQIRFALPEASDVTLAVYDMLGREVALLANGLHEAGSHEVTFNAEKLPSGVYIYRLQTDGFSETHRMLLLK